MKESTSDIIFITGTGIFTLIPTQLGALILKQSPKIPYVGLSIMVLSLLLFYISIQSFKEKKGTDKMDELEKKLNTNEKLLKT